jgi:hypothetical protein
MFPQHLPFNNWPAKVNKATPIVTVPRGKLQKPRPVA